MSQAASRYGMKSRELMSDDESLVEKIIHATESVVGDLHEPKRGILAVLPTSAIHGMRKSTGG